MKNLYAGQSTGASVYYSGQKDLDTQENRGFVYAFLSACFKDEPGAKLLAFFNESRIRTVNFLDAISSPEAEICRDVLQKIQIILEQNCEDFLPLRKQFAFLFLNPQGVNPFESVYRGPQKRLMDQPWVEVKSFYASAGMEKGAREEHPEDHAAVELGFMAQLAYLTSMTGPEEPDSAIKLLHLQKRFLDEHLLCWFPDLCRDIQARDEVALYRYIAGLGQSWVALDHLLLRHALDQ